MGPCRLESHAESGKERERSYENNTVPEWAFERIGCMSDSSLLCCASSPPFVWSFALVDISDAKVEIHADPVATLKTEAVCYGSVTRCHLVSHEFYLISSEMQTPHPNTLYLEISLDTYHMYCQKLSVTFRTISQTFLRFVKYLSCLEYFNSKHFPHTVSFTIEYGLFWCLFESFPDWFFILTLWCSYPGWPNLINLFNIPYLRMFVIMVG
jgi:hypothetical protein